MAAYDTVFSTLCITPCIESHDGCVRCRQICSTKIMCVCVCVCVHVCVCVCVRVYVCVCMVRARYEPILRNCDRSSSHTHNLFLSHARSLSFFHTRAHAHIHARTHLFLGNSDCSSKFATSMATRSQKSSTTT